MPSKDMKVKLKLNKDELTLVAGQDSLVGKLIAGCEGDIRINTPFGNRVIKTVKDSKGKLIDRPKKDKKVKD